jgi:hypothetical protein
MSMFLLGALKLCPPFAIQQGVLLCISIPSPRVSFHSLQNRCVFEECSIVVWPKSSTVMSSLCPISWKPSSTVDPFMLTPTRPDPRGWVGCFVGHCLSHAELLQTSAVLPIIVWSFLPDIDRLVSLYPCIRQSPRCMFVSPSATESVSFIIMCKAKSLVSEASGKKGLGVR